MNKFLPLIIAFQFLSNVCFSQSQENLKMWFDKPANYWEEALPIGNGRIGAMVFGIPYRERIQINESTFWSGAPSDNNNPKSLDNYKDIRKLIFEEKYKEATELTQQSIIAPNRRYCANYQTLGSVYFAFPGHENFDDYFRELNIENAVATTTYKVAGVTFKREAIASFNDQVIIVRFTANAKDMISFGISMDSPLKLNISTPTTNSIEATSTSSDYADVKGSIKATTIVKVINQGGQVYSNGISVNIKNANEAVVYISMATNFINFQDISGNDKELANKYLEKALTLPIDELFLTHTKVYQSLFNRVRLDLGITDSIKKPLNKRIEEFSKGNDPHLAMLYFQFGRYLLISGSQPGGQPLGLQGLWNQSVYPPWGGKYTVNINTEMNYWPSEPTNLTETNEPLVQMIQELSVSGNKTAQTMYGMPGWVMHHNTDIWRSAGAIDGVYWGMWPCGGAWLCQHLWYKYLYNGNKEYLKSIYPVLKSASQFYQSFLIEDPTHKWLVVSPSNSPENSPSCHPEYSIYAGTAMSTQLVFDLFDITIRSAVILKTDKELISDLKTKMKRLPPHMIGQHAQLQEWLEDWDNPNDKHRHISHLYAFFPSNQISPFRSPELTEGVRNTLIQRGDPSTGWSMNWKINCWARLLDGNHAYKMMKEQISLVTPTANVNFSGSGGTYPNFFDACPPFQIDGNFGFTNGLAEMLIQSHDEAIQLLPALPDIWGNGSVSGLCARGGFEIKNLIWENGIIKEITLKSKLGGNCRIRSYNELIFDNNEVPKQANGKNNNPYFYVPEINQPVFSKKITPVKFQTRKVFEYDIDTQEGHLYHLILKK